MAAGEDYALRVGEEEEAGPSVGHGRLGQRGEGLGSARCRGRDHLGPRGEETGGRHHSCQPLAHQGLDDPRVILDPGQGLGLEIG